MIEFPEAQALAAQLRAQITGKTVREVLPPVKPHKFCWFHGDPATYHTLLVGQTVQSADGFGIFVELAFSGGLLLSCNDGVILRCLPADKAPANYQLLLCFTDGTALVFTVAMYGGILLHDAAYEEPYYCKSRAALSPLSPDFPAFFREQLRACKPSASLKAFLATAQRFPGIGNGVLQDILFDARLHPKRKLATLTTADSERLCISIITVLRAMTDAGGRDTETTLSGAPGGYRTRLSKRTVAAGCPVCGGSLVKETYLGGSVYFCPACQPV